MHVCAYVVLFLLENYFETLHKTQNIKRAPSQRALTKLYDDNDCWQPTSDIYTHTIELNYFEREKFFFPILHFRTFLTNGRDFQ